MVVGVGKTRALQFRNAHKKKQCNQKYASQNPPPNHRLLPPNLLPLPSITSPPPSSLSEIVHHIRRHQNRTSSSIQIEPLALLEPIKFEPLPQWYETRSYDQFGAVHYNNRGQTVNIAPPSLYVNRWYAKEQHHQPNPISTTSENGNSTITFDDLQMIQEDAKLKTWGWGGSGTHLSLKKQEIYHIVKGMGSTLAWSFILYDFALR